MLVVRGAGSEIWKKLRGILDGTGEEERVEALHRGDSLPMVADRYLFCQGILFGRRAEEMSEDDIAETLFVNAMNVIAECNLILRHNKAARICIIGSESGFSWSFDDAYAAAKAAVHRYIETKRLSWPAQQLVGVAPGIIADAGMTTRRTDVHNLMTRERAHPKRRLLQAEEVAKLVHHLLYVDRGYISGTVIRMNGGEHTACRG